LDPQILILIQDLENGADLEELLSEGRAGYTASELLKKLPPEITAQYIDTFLKYGASPVELSAFLIYTGNLVFDENTILDLLMSDVDPNQVIDYVDQIAYADWILNIDMREILTYNASDIIDAGGDMDYFFSVLEKHYSWFTVEQMQELTDAGYDISNLIYTFKCASPPIQAFQGLVSAGLNPDEAFLILPVLDRYDVVEYMLNELLESGVNPDVIASSLDPDELIEFCAKLIEAGASIDLTKFIYEVSTENVEKYSKQLESLGVSKKLLDKRLHYI